MRAAEPAKMSAEAAARKAFEDGPWSRMTPHQRTKLLLKVADLIEQNREQLAELSSLDNGAPIMGGQGLVTSSVAGSDWQ